MTEKEYNQKMSHLEARLNLAKTAEDRWEITKEINRLEAHADRWGLDNYSALDHYLEEAQAGIL
ncbi:hypothetical protein [Synechocystis sp. LKSZ1]|uniref:hypothetical protein n=1 Tax=Synechocystis sp. LKSZ1 TaxID=3144951 RepID=UPI00336BD1A2